VYVVYGIRGVSFLRVFFQGRYIARFSSYLKSTATYTDGRVYVHNILIINILSIYYIYLDIHYIYTQHTQTGNNLH